MTGVMILPADAPHEEWLAARLTGIGASEIAAVMGISPWESPFSLYWRKVNRWTLDLSAEMEWGTRLEDAVAAKYAEDFPWLLVERGGLYQGAEPWMLATPDRMLYQRDMPADEWWGPCGLLETKTAHNADGWGEPDTDEIPVYYRAQVQWQMLVVGVESADVAVLIGGSDYRRYHVRRDDKDIRVMVEHGRRFMARLESGDPPDIDDHSATLATVKRLHPDLDDTEAEIPESIAAGYRRACEMKRKAEALKDRYEALLRNEMGRARKATANGAFVASRSIYDVKESTRKGYTVDKLNPARSRKS